MMTSENLIHIKLEYDEALKSKKDLLSSQMALLKVEKAIKGYDSYRFQGFELKTSLLKRMKELRSGMWNLQKILPRLKIPEILKKEEREEKKEKSVKKRERLGGSLEEQLDEIQRRLKELQSRGA